MAIRTIAGYRTISYEVATILARTPPWALVAEKCKNTYMRIREAKLEDRWDSDEDKKIRHEEEDKLYRKWKRRMKGEEASGKELRTAIDNNFEEWINRRDRGLNYHITQMLTNNGCFNTYLQRIQKIDSALCSHCDVGRMDTAKHTIEECEEWYLQREELKNVLKREVNLQGIVKALCERKESWEAANKFAQEIMKAKEEKERREKLATRRRDEDQRDKD